MSHQLELSPVPAFLGALPGPIAAIVEKLVRERLTSASALSDEMEAYVKRLEEAWARDEFIDRETALRVASQCRALLGQFDRQSIADGRHVIQAAVRYFILDLDDQGDLSSPIGFDDDQLVVDAAVHALGLSGI